MFRLSPSPLLIVLVFASHAHANQCASAFNAAGSEHMAVVEAFKKLREREPQGTVSSELQNKGIKSGDKIDAVVDARKKQWASVKQEMESLLARAKRLDARWLSVADKCQAAGNSTDATNAKKNKQALYGNGGIHDKIVKELRQVKCNEVTESIEFRRSMLMSNVDNFGISKALYEYALKYGLDRAFERKQEIMKACPVPRFPLNSDHFEKTANSLSKLWSALIQPYESTVKNPPKPPYTKEYKQNFANYIVKEASFNRWSSVATLLNLAAYKMPLDSADEEGGSTLLMVVTGSGNAKVLESLIAFAKANPQRGSLGVNARDKNGFTALSYCVVSEACKADVLRILLVDLKADKQIKSIDGLTAADLAKEENRADLLPLLRD